MPVLTLEHIYDLANEHFGDVTLATTDGKKQKGKFVRFKISGTLGDCVYPAEKYCFLPEENTEEFEHAMKKYEGVLPGFPPYILQLGLHEIREITIHPDLVA